MNDKFGKQMFDGQNSQESSAKLPELLDIIQKNFYHLEKCMELSKNALTECHSTMEELKPQMMELQYRVKNISSNNNQKKLDASESVQGKNRLKRMSEQEVIEEITVEESEKPRDSSSLFGTKNNVGRNKKQRTNLLEDDDDDDEIVCIITQKPNDKSVSDPSGEILKISETKQKRLKNDKQITEAYSAENVVSEALKRTGGVLSAEELNTFLYLADTVQDPVQLAKVSFTKDVKMLHFQLMTFHFHLKVANDVAEKEKGISSTDRELENKAQRLVHAFEAEI